MLKYFFSSQAVGLDIQGNYLQIAQLGLHKKTARIELLHSYSLEEESETPSNVNPLYIKHLQKSLTISALPASDTLVRSMEIKLTKEKDIQSVLAFQAEPLLPFPLETAILQNVQLYQAKGSTFCTLVAALKERISLHLEKNRRWGIDPEIISSVPIALSLFGYHFASTSSESPRFTIHVEQDEIICILAKQGKALASRSFSRYTGEGGDQSIALEMVRTITSFAKQHKISLTAEESFDILLTGNLKTAPNLESSLSNAFQAPILFPREESSYTVEEIQRFAIPIGLALSALFSNDQLVNFRQQELAYPNPWKRLKKALTLYFFLCALTALLLLACGQIWIRHQEREILQSYVNLLATIQNDKKAPEKSDILAIQELPRDQIIDRLAEVQKSIHKAPSLFPLSPDMPRVSDFLAWLGKHPRIVSASEEDTKPLLQIESLTYTLMRRPEKKKERERYQVKVELEFTTETPKFAREFHDALIAPNEMVDPRNEIKWTADRDQYRTSFFLKDKTYYPR